MTRRLEARFERLIRIGDMVFGELRQPPPEPLANGQNAPGENVPGENVPLAALYAVVHERGSLAEALQRLPFDVPQPAWLPEGFVQDEEVKFVVAPARLQVLGSPPGTPPLVWDDHAASAYVSWAHPDGRTVNLRVSQLLEPGPSVVRGIAEVEPGTLDEVRVKGYPAALLTRQVGWLPSTGQQQVIDGLWLRWEANGLQYELSAPGKPFAREALLRVAESLH